MFSSSSAPGDVVGGKNKKHLKTLRSKSMPANANKKAYLSKGKKSVSKGKEVVKKMVAYAAKKMSSKKK